MELEPVDRSVVACVQDGIPIVSRPFEVLGEDHGLSAETLIGSIRSLLAAGVIKRFGVVVDHRRLGFKANAMVVWDVDDASVDKTARRLCKHADITLCYRRPRRPPAWPYNLYCMIHGRSKAAVLACLEDITINESLQDIPREVLFSRRRFKQRGARYVVVGQQCAAAVQDA